MPPGWPSRLAARVPVMPSPRSVPRRRAHRRRHRPRLSRARSRRAARSPARARPQHLHLRGVRGRGSRTGSRRALDVLDALAIARRSHSHEAEREALSRNMRPTPAAASRRPRPRSPARGWRRRSASTGAISACASSRVGALCGHAQADARSAARTSRSRGGVAAEGRRQSSSERGSPMPFVSACARRGWRRRRRSSSGRPRAPTLVRLGGWPGMSRRRGLSFSAPSPGAVPRGFGRCARSRCALPA